VLHVRLSQITPGTLALDGCIKYIEDEVSPAMDSQPGSLGLSLLAIPEPGVAILESFWASQLALQAGENTDAILRGELARQASGPVTVEDYEVVVFEREARLRGGQAVRLTRVEVKPSGVDDVIDVVGDTVVPSLAETPGFCSALLFADPASGCLISETVWQDAQTQAAAQSVAAIIRANVLDDERGGWLHTGDVAREDDDGFWTIIDRKKDMIVSGGFNVYPREIEDVLTSHSDVSAAAVIGVPDDKWGESVKAVVVARPGAMIDTEALIVLVRERKGPVYAPKSVDVVEALPLTPVGKADKVALRERYWAGQDRRVH
jgi:acyl-CoA synthetase (AMP-forming)/AMP-acid ligase II